MRILNENWDDNYLDYALLPGTYRIKVLRWYVLADVAGLYYAPERDWRMIWNYWREYGTKQVWRKVQSRRKESFRNKKYVALGIGEVLESGDNALNLNGRVVSFVAPSHPLCVERVVLPQELVEPTGEPPPGINRNRLVLFQDFRPSRTIWTELAGWSQYSGVQLDRESILSVLRNFVSECPQAGGQELDIGVASPTRECSSANGDEVGAGLRGVLFGLGHYAKTIILPNLDSRIRVVKVHEIDPCQVGDLKLPFQVDSSPVRKPDEKFDVFFLAGFHHTHAPLAAEALRQGAIAVVEKPIATMPDDLETLLALARLHPGRIFAGFHKRYSELNALALSDLRVEPRDPVSYFCIVHEARLPALHWYRWPNSQSRLISNGCHWVDHFLHLNQFALPAFYDVSETSSGDVCVVIELVNRASFTMTLTDQGSSRIGVEDYVELRANDVTVRIVNGSSYSAENSRRVLRRVTANRANSYERMYSSITGKIASGEPGDSLQSLECSGKLVLDLERRLTLRRQDRKRTRTQHELAFARQ